MNKPNNYDNTQSYQDYETLEPGGYVCIILKVEETKSSTQKDMIKIFLDIAEGENKSFYSGQWKSDTRTDKKWPCIVYQLINDNDGNCNRGLKTFINAVAESNKDFDANSIWGEEFSKHFKNRLVGGMFRKEQYENKHGDLKWSTKCFAFKDIATIRDGVDVPEDKYLPQKSAPSYLNDGYQGGGFAEATDMDPGDLPF